MRSALVRTGPTLRSCEWSQKWHKSKFFYALKRDARFHDLRHRLIIDWGRSRSWVQNLNNKQDRFPVLEILESGRKLLPFAHYLEFSLTYNQLRDLFDNEHAHPDWRAHMSAVGGIDVILAEGSGNLYVGSATGESGVWGRWRDYANSGHGGNVHLRKLMERNSSYPERFRFSILQILPKTMARARAHDIEELYKKKLGTRTIGLN